MPKARRKAKYCCYGWMRFGARNRLTRMLFAKAWQSVGVASGLRQEDQCPFCGKKIEEAKR